MSGFQERIDYQREIQRVEKQLVESEKRNTIAIELITKLMNEKGELQREVDSLRASRKDSNQSTGDNE